MIKPILFNTEMVRAILDGRKTVTRRLIKTSHKNAYGFNVVRNSGNIVGVIDYDENETMFDNYTQPPYYPKDAIYVRETFAKEFVNGKWIYVYKTHDRNRKILEDVGGRVIKWCPSIHMLKGR